MNYRYSYTTVCILKYCGIGLLAIWICIFVYHYLLTTSILCSNQEFHRLFLPKLCEEIDVSEFLFYIYDSSGFPIPSVNLCAILCTSKLDVSCHKYHLNKPMVFTVNYITENTSGKMVIKAVIEEEEDEDAYWYQKVMHPYIPTADELQNMVNTHISSFVGRPLDGSFNEIKSYLYSIKVNDLKVHEAFWKFIYDHEFLTAYLFQNFNVFPKILGTCQNLYGVEYAKPLIENPLMSINIPFNVRISKSIDLLLFIEKLQIMWFEPIHLCDIKHDHFGWNSENELLFLDLDSVVTASSLKNIMLSTPKCYNDDDCSYFDCHGHCLPNKRCSGKRVNTNLQILCSKVFLGKSDSSVLTFVGLLLDSQISENLQEALEICSKNPDITSNNLLHALKEQDSLLHNNQEL